VSVSPGAAGSPAGVDEGRVVDFRRPAPLLAEQAKVLRAVHDDIAERLSPMLSSRLRTPCRLTVSTLEMVSGSELAEVSGTQSVVAVIDTALLGAPLAWTFPSRTAAVVVDLLLGGTGRDEPSGRALTEIEIQVLGRLVQQCLAPIAAAWSSLVALRPRVGKVHADPDEPAAIAPGEPVLRTELEVLLGDLSLTAALWVPNGVLAAALRGLEPAAPAPSASRGASDGPALDVDVIRSVPVDVCVTFPPVPMTPAAILALDVGDVIRLHPTDQPLELSAGDVRIGWVRPAQHAGRTACQVLVLEDPRSHPSTSRG
jgi:flagellar motor switch protein FliM